MKVTVSFELDLSAHPSFNIKNLKGLVGGLQNLSSFFHELHLHNLQKVTESMARPHSDPVYQKAIMEHNEWDAAVSAQLFNNYTVKGITDDGHSFESNHQEPGYKETMLVDGLPYRV